MGEGLLTALIVGLLVAVAFWSFVPPAVTGLGDRNCDNILVR